MATRPAVAASILLLVMSTSCFAASVPPAGVTVVPLRVIVLQRARDCTERADHLAF